MAVPASNRGWGNPGVPGAGSAAAYEHDHIVTVTAGGLKFRVRREVAPLFCGFLDEIVRRGYPIAGGTPDDWGYNCRYIRGYEAKKILSNHAWGLACDINSTQNPMTEDGRVHSNIPTWVVSVARSYGLDWGGNYKGSRKDPMHFEFLGTPDQATHLCGAVAKGGPRPGADDDNSEEEDDEMRGVLMRIDGQSAVWCVTPIGRWHVPDPDTMNMLRFFGVVRHVDGTPDDVIVIPAAQAKALEGVPKVAESIA